MAKNRFLSFRERLKKVYKSRDNVVYHLNGIDLQFEHFIEEGFAVPPKLIEKYNKASELVDQFDEIIAEPSDTFKERSQRKAMLITFEEIFTDLSVQLRNEIIIASKEWKAQKYGSDRDKLEKAYEDARDNIEDIDD